MTFRQYLLQAYPNAELHERFIKPTSHSAAEMGHEGITYRVVEFNDFEVIYYCRTSPMSAMILIDKEMAQHLWDTKWMQLYGCDMRDGSEFLIESNADFSKVYAGDPTIIEFGIEGELFGQPYEARA